jgi:hypothetical protein
MDYDRTMGHGPMPGEPGHVDFDRHEPIEGGYQTTLAEGLRAAAAALGAAEVEWASFPQSVTGKPGWVEGTVEQLFAEDPEDYPVKPMSLFDVPFVKKGYKCVGGVPIPMSDEERRDFDDWDDGVRVGLDDMVNSPNHYASGEQECIDGIRQAVGEEGFKAFCHGNAFKYVWRANLKGNADQDFAKAIWYLRMARGDDPRKS